jgi:hypothetical protein
MKFGQVFLILLAAANAVGATKMKRNLRTGRDLGTSMAEANWLVGGYQETLGYCTGAVCGIWGDPHILTCDGLGYDCNGQGLHTMMKNFLYNIQANFIHVNTLEMMARLRRDKFPVATYANDIIIQNVEDTSKPVLQFSFPSFHNEEDIVPSEVGCVAYMQYEPELEGYARTHEPTLVDCRIRCESVPGCTKFTYKTNTECRLAGEDAVITTTDGDWSRRVSGEVNTCGHPDRYEDTEENLAARAQAKVIGNGSGNTLGEHHHHGPGCPVLFYLDGELIDISNMEDGAYLWGTESSKDFAKLEGYNQIKVVYATDSGADSEIMLETAGDGPGEMFSCHWNMFVCLPEADEDLFSAYGVGILGSPDNNSQNDWMDPDGNVLPLPVHDGGTEGQEAYDYCRNNWCVSQVDSIMTYPEGNSFEDVKCLDEEYVPVNVDDPDYDCLETADTIHEICDAMPMMMRNACEVECCLANCPVMEEMVEEIEDLVTLSTETSDCIYDNPVIPPIPLCDEADRFIGTGEELCPDSPDSVVQVIHSSTTGPIPEGQPIIFGINHHQIVDDERGLEVTFHVENPFESSANAYVRYSKMVGLHATDPACESITDLVPGCQTNSQAITVGCFERPGQDPFAIVDISFASDDTFVVDNAVAGSEIHKCCAAPELEPEVGVIKYTFEIKCGCPPSELLEYQD